MDLVCPTFGGLNHLSKEHVLRESFQKREKDLFFTKILNIFTFLYVLNLHISFILTLPKDIYKYTF